MRRFFFTLLLLTFAWTALAQPAEAFLTVYGKVMDGRTDQPVAYASVSLTGTSISNVTNADGLFSLKIPGHRHPSSRLYERRAPADRFPGQHG